jgi:putative ABC transport system substrate-binding protein
MNRRAFITLLGGAAAWPIAAPAQQPGGMRRIGLLMNFAENDPEGQRRLAIFKEALEQLGWSENRNIRMEHRWIALNRDDLLQAHAAELARLPLDVIFAHTSPVVLALRQETKTVPIVFVQVSDPVANGIVESLARPGSNATGFMNFEPAMGGKWLQILKELPPNVKRIALLFNPKTPSSPLFVSSAEAAASSFSVELIKAEVYDPANIERTIDSFAQEPDGAAIVLPDVFTTTHRSRIISSVSRNRLPTVYPFRYFVDDGGLMSYGIDIADMLRRGASYVDRILRGTKPSDLPVQAPTRFELVINLKAAKAIGLTVSESFLLRADEVVD